ncbi:uncharacterized protein LOC144152436 [Haemaphysalis longicornis]
MAAVGMLMPGGPSKKESAAAVDRRPGDLAAPSRAPGSQLCRKVLGVAMGEFTGPSGWVLLGIVASMEVFIPGSGIDPNVNRTKMEMLQTAMLATMSRISFRHAHFGDAKRAKGGAKGETTGINTILDDPTIVSAFYAGEGRHSQCHLPVDNDVRIATTDSGTPSLVVSRSC